MELITTELPARTKKSGEESGITLAAGESLVVETTPGGSEILEATVPAGKEWRATVSVSIDETDS